MWVDSSEDLPLKYVFFYRTKGTRPSSTDETPLGKSSLRSSCTWLPRAGEWTASVVVADVYHAGTRVEAGILVNEVQLDDARTSSLLADAGSRLSEGGVAQSVDLVYALAGTLNSQPSPPPSVGETTAAPQAQAQEAQTQAQVQAQAQAQAQAQVQAQMETRNAMMDLLDQSATASITDAESIKQLANAGAEVQTPKPSPLKLTSQLPTTSINDHPDRHPGHHPGRHPCR